MQITTGMVRALMEAQFPQWAGLPIHPVENSGHDNRTFHLGDKMSVRLPSARRYVAQVEKEARWLPYLQPHLSLPIPAPLAMGKASATYPWPWSVNQWIEGETVKHENIAGETSFALGLAAFLKELYQIDAKDGPGAGAHNFHRGGQLAVYDGETRRALQSLDGVFDRDALAGIWQRALASQWEEEPVWVHGDVAVGNLLVCNGELCGVIDFGSMGVGDPACDLVMAWTFFGKDGRDAFMREMKLDENTWNRARGWALWKALITYEAADASSSAAQEAGWVLRQILKEAG